MSRWVVPAVLLLALLMTPAFATPARAADVSVLLIGGDDVVWHVGSATSAVTRIEVNVGDTLRLRVENQAVVLHTFTAPQFQVDETLNPGDVFFWNHTVVAADAGDWQYYCIPHSGGTYPNRVGMVGILAFRSPAPPQQPLGLEIIVIVVVVIAVIGGVAWYALRRRK